MRTAARQDFGWHPPAGNECREHWCSQVLGQLRQYGIQFVALEVTFADTGLLQARVARDEIDHGCRFHLGSQPETATQCANLTIEGRVGRMFAAAELDVVGDRGGTDVAGEPTVEETTQMGPLINQRRIDAIERIIADAEKRGGKIETGGRRPTGNNKGFFFQPTVISQLPDDAPAIAEENFGPIAAITPFTQPDEVYSRANAGDFGLAAYAFTRDPQRIRETVARLQSGMVGINSFALAAAEAPFGGVKMSGIGREGGSEGLHDYLNVKLAQIAV